MDTTTQQLGEPLLVHGTFVASVHFGFSYGSCLVPLPKVPMQLHKVPLLKSLGQLDRYWQYHADHKLASDDDLPLWNVYLIVLKYPIDKKRQPLHVINTVYIGDNR